MAHGVVYCLRHKELATDDDDADDGDDDDEDDDDEGDNGGDDDEARGVIMMIHIPIAGSQKNAPQYCEIKSSKLKLGGSIS